jgi:hypothetical protein
MNLNLYQLYLWLSPIVVVLLGWVAKKIAELINANVANKWLSAALTRLDYAAINAVKTIEQTIVARLKATSADGKLTEADIAMIKNDAMAAARQYLGENGLRELQGVLGDDNPAAVDVVLEQRIEAAVHDLKASRPQL